MTRVWEWVRAITRVLAIFPFLISVISFVIEASRKKRAEQKERARRDELSKAFDKLTKDKTTDQLESWFRNLS